MPLDVVHSQNYPSNLLTVESVDISEKKKKKKKKNQSRPLQILSLR